jgi:hypothetical protein
MSKRKGEKRRDLLNPGIDYNVEVHVFLADTITIAAQRHCIDSSS